MDVSVVIVNYNTRELTANCIKSVNEMTNSVDYEIILVDNNSNDGSVNYIKEKFPSVIIVGNGENIGFGRANNKGAKLAKGKYLLLLNSDTLLIDNALLSMFNFMEEHKDIAACGGDLLDANRQSTYCHGKFPSLKMELADMGLCHLFRNYYIHNLSSHQKVTEGDIDNVDYICGADIFIPRELYNSIGGFDEDFFMYYEETDLFRRLKGRGIRSVILPNVHIVHLEGASQKREYSISKFKMYNKSRFMYYRKAGYNAMQIWFLKFICILYMTFRIPKWNGNYCKMCNLILRY